MMDSSDEILRSWEANAENWISAVDGNEIESRRLVTNSAIIQTILKYHPDKVLDIGCGEGWLIRTLSENGINGHGIDAIETLIKNAIKKGGNNYSVCSYEDLIKKGLKYLNEFNAVVINFALLDKKNSKKLLLSLATLLKKNSIIFIQTLHPVNMALTHSYQTGWKEGSWAGLKKEFIYPYKWYFRTLEDWFKLFIDAGLTLKEFKEPIHPETKKPASAIFVLSV